MQKIHTFGTNYRTRHRIMIKLLLVEDDPNLRYMVQTGLEDIIGGYEVVTASNGAEGLEVWKATAPDIIISDIDMPMMDGFEMVEHIRKMDGDTPILFASALTSPRDVKQGYKLGANNYVKKPFVAEELDAHIQALLKMKESGKMRNANKGYRLGRYLLDSEQACMKDEETGELKILTHREADLLRLLAESKNETVRREAILSRFWNTEDDYFASRSLDVFVTKLRKLFDNEPRVVLKTIRGVGLRLEVTE